MADDPTSSSLQQLSKASSASYNGFLYKMIASVVFLLVIPFFPSEAPLFLNKMLLTGSWELLHLLFVGVAVSYGIFSTRNRDSEKDFVTRVDVSPYDFSKDFQTRSIFDNSEGISTGFEETSPQIWSARSYVDDQPLFLPLRNLKCCDSDKDLGKSFDHSRSCLGSRTDDSCDFVNLDPEEGFEEPRSPLSWRSISGSFKHDENKYLHQNYVLSSHVAEKDPDSAAATNFINCSLCSSERSYDPRSYVSFQEKRKNKPPPIAPPSSSPGSHSHELRTWRIQNQIEKSKSVIKDREVDFSKDETDLAEGMKVMEPPPPPEMEEGDEISEEQEDSDDGRDCGRDVDKKADEFIAKFRERIRLQRIDSIKRCNSRDQEQR